MEIVIKYGTMWSVRKLADGKNGEFNLHKLPLHRLKSGLYYDSFFTILHGIHKYQIDKIRFSMFRLRTGIGNSSENWKNCSMFVQDLVRPNVNVTAEISQKAAQNFQEMCQIFAKKLKWKLKLNENKWKNKHLV